MEHLHGHDGRNLGHKIANLERLTGASVVIDISSGLIHWHIY